MPKKDRVLTISEARRMATEYGLTPCKIKGKNAYEFSKSSNIKLIPLSWLELETELEKKNLRICESFGFLRIIKSSQE